MTALQVLQDGKLGAREPDFSCEPDGFHFSAFSHMECEVSRLSFLPKLSLPFLPAGVGRAGGGAAGVRRVCGMSVGPRAMCFCPPCLFHTLVDGKAKHSPTNDWDTNAVWVDARRAVTVTFFFLFTGATSYIEGR